MIDQILHRVRPRAQCRDLPDRFGPGKTAHERHRPWSADGPWQRPWQRPLQQAQAQAQDETEAEADAAARSTGTSRSTPPSSACTSMLPASAPTRRRPPPQKGAGPRDHQRNSVTEPTRPPDGGGPAGEGMGRSRAVGHSWRRRVPVAFGAAHRTAGRDAADPPWISRGEPGGTAQCCAHARPWAAASRGGPGWAGGPGGWREVVVMRWSGAGVECVR
ncbi:transposase [Streptomyces sp. NPDC059008]|uniref:transposase n=1 Tax=Streptomyces sp. NPDC059008 TaxID=3346693 RepID=UPI00368366C1